MRPSRRNAFLALVSVFVLALSASPAQAGYDRTFEAGSLIIPMDLAYQDTGMLQAYGLVFQLLDQGVTVYWVIDPDKTWHSGACDTAGDECTWDCAEEGSGVKCTYPTASPDFYAGAMVHWDGDGALSPGAMITRHGYRGGPFVIDASEATTARAIIDAWNDMSAWDANPWARRTEFSVVSVHEATESFDGYVKKEMIEAPTIAVFSDGNEDIATGYLRAAGIPQSNGNEFPAGRCTDPAICGPGTDNPDMLSVVAIMGDMGTCDAPNTDHRNGALFAADGTPAYCQIMSMHWGVNDRETVECDGGGCPATQAECAGETFTYHGHEVVAEVRQFLSFPTHFFAECQAVNAYENTVPNPNWPYLDDDDRLGHFLTTTGMPPDCPCDGATDGGDYECVTLGCDGGTRDCCMPRDVKEKGAGFLIADMPNEDMLQILNPQVPYNQLDGAYGTVGGSEPAYNLSTFLGTAYKNDLDVTFITGPDGPGDEDVWMTGFVDGECDIIGYDEFASPGECNLGKVSYLGGHRYATDTPISNHWDTQGTRLFLNALFEADCVTGGLTGMGPNVALSWTGVRGIDSARLPTTETFQVQYTNSGSGAALASTLTVTVPAGLTVTDYEAGGTMTGDSIVWDLGDVAPAATGTRSITLSFSSEGSFTLQAVLGYGGTREARASHTVDVGAGLGGDGGVDGGGDGGGGGDDDGGCGCRAVGAGNGTATFALIAMVLLWLRRRRS